MKRLLCFLVIATGLFEEVVSQSKVSIDPMELDLGSLYSGAVKTGRYTIKNIGNAPLEIKHVQPSCGCTTVRRPQSQIQPGKSDYIDIEFSAVPGMRGKTEKYVFVSTNDPTAGEMTLKLFADVKEELQAVSELSSIPFGGLILGKEVTQTLTYKNVSQKKITVKELSSTSKNVKASADKMSVNPSDSITVTVSLVPDKEGFAFEHVTLTTDSRNQPKVEIRISYIGVKAQ
ncbi:MAG: DUF1573 domain-containing protein [Ignavibacteriales bacterium]|nr:DUF1573 domain-containing protein [Ignavibacteriales bacterium]